MMTLMNIGLMIYLVLVAVIGTLGNGIILLAYGNRWNSAKSTSIIFILILACVDLWTCSIAVPTIALMEYRDFEVPTLLCRFYSFSKNLIIVSSLIMSFIAIDRFLNIAMPHYRLLNPRRVKFLLTLIILIAIGLGILTALAFASRPHKTAYLVHYSLFLSGDLLERRNESHEVQIGYEQSNSTSLADFIHLIYGQLKIPVGANVTNINLTYKSTRHRCFADTSIISEPMREILRHISSKCFFVSIGIVTILYTITFLWALHRQNPRIRALKKSIYVLDKFDSYSSANPAHHHLSLLQSQKRADSLFSSHSPIRSSNSNPTPAIESRHLLTQDPQVDELIQLQRLNAFEQETIPSDHLPTDHPDASHISNSDATSDDLQPVSEKFQQMKQVSFKIQNENYHPQQDLAFLSTSFDENLDGKSGRYYRLPCPCSTTRQLLIKFHFAQPKFDLNQWFCSCCWKRRSSSPRHQPAIAYSNEEETSTILSSVPSVIQTSSSPVPLSSSVNSETLKRQLHRHRLKQIRMASTFLLITVSFVLFYLPSILNAEQFIKSHLMIYYLYLCTHALNPIIYCFMNRSLRAYILSMFNCRRKYRRSSITTGAMATVLDR